MRSFFYNGILAQLVEHLTFNQVVGGSIPPYLMPRKAHKTVNVLKAGRFLRAFLLTK